MSSIIDGLKKLVSTKTTAAIGSVVKDNGNVLLVASPTGVREFPKSNDNTYASGDTIRIFNGVVVNKVKGDEYLPVYYV